MPRQFSLKTLLWLMALVGALFSGREWGIRHERQNKLDELVKEQERLRDEWLARIADQSKRDSEFNEKAEAFSRLVEDQLRTGQLMTPETGSQKETGIYTPGFKRVGGFRR